MLSHWVCLTQDAATMTLAEIQDCLRRIAYGKSMLAGLQLVALVMLVLCLSVSLILRRRLRVLRHRQPQPLHDLEEDRDG